MKEELREFTNRMERFKSRLTDSLKKDGIISDNTENVNIRERNGRLIVNGEELSEELTRKYKSMLEEEFGEGKGNYNDGNFDFRFDFD